MGNCPTRPRRRNDNIFWIIILILLLGDREDHCGRGCGFFDDDNLLIIIIIILLLGQCNGPFDNFLEACDD